MRKPAERPTMRLAARLSPLSRIPRKTDDLTTRRAWLLHCLLCWLIIGSALFARAACAEDAVLLKSADGRSQYRLQGEILEYTGSELVLMRGGREERFPTTRVLEILGAWSETQQEAEKLLAAGQSDQALVLFRQAVNNEPRAWVRRWLLARCTLCYQQLGQHDIAGDTIAVVLESDPLTPHLDVLPLNWGPVPTNAAIEGRAARWLQSPQSAVRLLGASWLLSTARRNDALGVLKQLTTDADPRVALLAATQLWRVDVLTVRADELPKWAETIERLPSALRGGPHFVLAEAWARHDQPQAAAWNYMRVPILFAQQKELAAAALFGAATQLEKLQQWAEAETLYRELIAQHPASPRVVQAQQRVAQLRERQQNQNKP